MSGVVSLPEDDLSCPVCCDIFSDPVLLACSHSFCRGCLRRCWDAAASRACPVCRRRASSKRCPPSNLALRNLCEALVLARGQGGLAAGGKGALCALHGETLKLFCLEDKQPVCVVCQASKTHKTHDFSPVEEAASSCKDELCASLKTLRDTLDSLTRAQENFDATLAHIKSQALETERRIKDQFGQLHRFLHEEEAAMLAALREEEEGKTSLVTKEKMTETAGEIAFLTETIGMLEQEITAEDLALLQNFKATEERVKLAQQQHPLGVSSVLLDVTKHLGNLKHRVWDKMRHHVQFTPVTLDPNTAHPCLILSDDLTSLHYSAPPLSLPDSAERFHVSAEVLGVPGHASGSHSWQVEIGDSDDWLLGVASESVPRTAEVEARPENGFWTLCLRDGQYRAMTSPPTPLTVVGRPRKVRVQLDWDKGDVSFFDPAADDNGVPLCSFSQTFTERVFPYFYTQSKQPLRILGEQKYAHSGCQELETLGE